MSVKLYQIEKNGDERTAAELRRKEKYFSESLCFLTVHSEFGEDDGIMEAQSIPGENEVGIKVDTESEIESVFIKKKIKENTKTLRLCAALDKYMVSVRDAMHIISSVLDSLKVCRHPLRF